MADIAHTALFLLVNIDWGDYGATINYMRFRFGFI